MSDTPELDILYARANRYHTDPKFHTLVTIVRAVFKIEGMDEAAQLVEKLEQALANNGLAIQLEKPV